MLDSGGILERARRGKDEGVGSARGAGTSGMVLATERGKQAWAASTEPSLAWSGLADYDHRNLCECRTAEP